MEERRHLAVPKKGHYSRRATRWLGQIARYHPELFVHWRLGVPFPAE